MIRPVLFGWVALMGVLIVLPAACAEDGGDGCRFAAGFEESWRPPPQRPPPRPRRPVSSRVSASFRFAYSMGLLLPVHDGRYREIYRDFLDDGFAWVWPEESFSVGVRFANGHGMDGRIRIHMVSWGNSVGEFSFPLSLLYNLVLNPNDEVGVTFTAGVTFMGVIADRSYLGMGPSVSVGLEILQLQSIHIPIEIRYEFIRSLNTCQGGSARGMYGCSDLGGLVLSVGVAFQ